MLDFLTKFFRREESSRSLARERLRLVLMSDRVALAPETFDAMKGEMLGVLQRYLDIDEPGLDVHFENGERRFMLLANIPVLNIKSGEQIERERQRIAATGGNGVPRSGGAGSRRRRRRRRSHRNEGATNGEPQRPGAAQSIASPDGSSASSDAGADEPRT